MKIRLPVSWEVCGMVEIEANTINEAMDIFEKTQDHIPLPDDFDYVDGSFDLTAKEPEVIQLYNEGIPIGTSEIIYSSNLNCQNGG